MKKDHWREFVEVLGIVSIVAMLLLVAWELRETNRIARADAGAAVASRIGQIHLRRMSDPDFAQLFPKIAAPNAHLITATEASRIDGLARYVVNVFTSAQDAFEAGMIDADALRHYRHQLDTLLEDYPGLRRYIVNVYRGRPELGDAEIFQGLAEPAGDQSERDSERTAGD
jgi:hypothetical protein